MADEKQTDQNEEVEVGLGEVRALVRLTLWAALIALGGWLSFPLPPLGVPVSLQTFFVIMAGLYEGPKRGAMAAGLYLGVGLLGLPVFAGGVGGPAILLKPSAGFALGFPLGAAIAGLAVRTGVQAVSFKKAFLWTVLAHIVIYLFGFIGFLVNAKMVPLVAGGLLLAYAPGCLIKCIIASGIRSRHKHKVAQ